VPDEPQERQRLLDLIADHCIEHGVADLTLRGIARAVGSNNRMLLYYFGSKEEMISAALVAAGARFPLVFQAFERLETADGALDKRLVAAWRSLSAAVNLPFIRLFFEVVGLAAHQPGRFDAFLGSVGSDWADRVAVVFRREGMGVAESRRAGREIVALWRGLQLDLVSGHDRGSIDRTYAAAAARLAATVG
jgi:AcrR family transcriptional regulator